MGDAKSEYLAARLTNDLQQTLFERDKKLWDRRIATEQQFLRSQAAAEVTRIKVELARPLATAGAVRAKRSEARRSR
jgi:cobalt-zinc-cadmium efflux system membrane fusion protein